MQSVILLPGVACDVALWQGLLPALVSQHRVHVSDVHAHHDTLPDMAAALLARHPGRHVLVGASMGGMLALHAARLAPGRVLAAALLGTTARPDTPELVALRSQAIRMFEQGRMDEVLRANVPFAFHPNGLRKPALVDDYLAMVGRAGVHGLVRQNRAVMARDDSRPHLPALRCPVLIACGEADQLTTPEHAREMAALMPHAQLDIVPGAGHMLTMEQPARLAALLFPWLRGLPAAD